MPQGPPSWPRIVDDVIDEEVAEALRAAAADGSWGRYHGPHCERLAEALAAYHGISHATLCCSGTFAVELALRAVKVGPGDEVIMAGYDFSANFRAVEATGARPVLVDIDPGNWCLDPAHLPAALSDATAAVLVSHLHGGLAPMREITQFATEHNLAVVEDACQSPGALVQEGMAGTWGDVGVLSFGGSKLLTAGRGGALLTNREDLHQRAKIYCERGNNAFPLSEIQAAVLLPQLKRLDERNAVRSDRVQYLLAAIAANSGARGLRPLIATADHADPIFYKFPWLLREPNEASDQDRDVRAEVIAAAQDEGIALDAGFRGFAGRSERRCRKVGDLPHSRRAATSTVLLHHPVLLEADETIGQVAVGLCKVDAALL